MLLTEASTPPRGCGRRVASSRTESVLRKPKPAKQKTPPTPLHRSSVIHLFVPLLGKAKRWRGSGGERCWYATPFHASSRSPFWKPGRSQAVYLFRSRGAEVGPAVPASRPVRSRRFRRRGLGASRLSIARNRRDSSRDPESGKQNRTVPAVLSDRAVPERGGAGLSASARVAVSSRPAWTAR